MSKTVLPGSGLIAILMPAGILWRRQFAGIVLPMLLFADIFAV
jgi:hypothetical protein